LKRLVIVEGPTDKVFIEELARRLGLEARALMTRGTPSPDAVSRLVEFELRRGKYSKVIVLMDQHNLPENECTRRLEEILEAISHEAKRGVLVKRCLESWILAAHCICSDPEGLENPVRELRELYRRRYLKSPEAVRSVAREIDVSHAREKSPTFKQLLEALQDP